MAKRLDDLAPQGLLDRARRAVDLVDAASRIRVFCHYDPDGTTSASILARALMRRGKRIHASMAHALDRASADRLQAESNELFAEAADRKIVVPERRLSLRDLPLAKAIAQSIRPYFRGLSGRPDASAALLKKAGFDPDISLRQLEPAARRKLTSVLAAHLVEQGAAPEALDAIVEDRYWIEPDQIYAQDLV